jgi:hypothetical protein
MQRLSVLLIAAVATACGGGSSSTSTPTAPSASGQVSIAVPSVSATTERTATGVTYWSAFSLRETGGQSGATISNIRIALANSSRNGGGSFALNDRVLAGGSKSYNLGIDSVQTTDLYNQVSLTVSYTNDGGVVGTYTSSPSAISAPPSTPAPQSGDAYSFVSASPITCVQPGNSIGACSGTAVLRVATNVPIGQALSFNFFPGAFLYEATMNASAPTNLTFVMSSRINQAYCYDPGPINTGRPTPPAAQTYLTVQATTITLPTPIAVSCSR